MARQSGSYKFNGDWVGGHGGYKVSSAGDVDGDGSNDLLIGVRGGEFGEIYLITAADLAAADMADGTEDGMIDPANVAAQTTSYKFVGEDGGDRAGYAVSSAGDVDGDGKDDLLIGAPGVRNGDKASGASYLITAADLLAADAADGTTDGIIDLANVAEQAASYKFIGAEDLDDAGFSVSKAGDVDGDGKDDFLIGTFRGSATGASYLVTSADLGAADTSDGTADGVIDLANVSAQKSSYKFIGAAGLDRMLFTVSFAGDVNGDGKEDLLISSKGDDLSEIYLITTDDLVSADSADGLVDGVIDLGLTNSVAAGSVMLSGVDTEGNELTADASAIVDIDGIVVESITYQWLRDGIAIAGATGANYELLQVDVGASIRVLYSYTNNSGVHKIKASDPTATISNVNDAPSGSVVVSGDPSINEVLTADTSSVADADGLGTFSYQWFRDGVAIFGATDETYKVARLDIRQPLTVQVSFRDGYGAEENLTSAAVTPAGSPPGVTVDLQDDTTGEDGSTGSFGINLNSGITSDVTLTFTISDATEASLSTKTITFTPTDWNEVQIVSLRGLDDFDNDGDTDFTVTVTISTDDALYQNLSITPLSFTNLEDDEDAPIELVGSDEADTMLGQNGDDRLYGGGGRDELWGMRGDDRLYGQANDDMIYGGEGNDLLVGGYDDDSLFGGSGNDELYGGIGSDFLEGGIGDDLLFGGAGKDILLGGAGEDKLFGGLGADILRGGRSGDYLGGGAGRDVMFGARGSDHLAGNAGRDVLRGGRGNDQLEGDKGFDELFGGLGNDILSGGFGNDRLKGGAGKDVFVFSADPGYGSDRVIDFKDGVDEIKIAGASFSDLTIRFTSAGHTRIEIADNNVVVLENIALSLISAADFDFG